jgi:hypothetical protein
VKQFNEVAKLLSSTGILMPGAQVSQDEAVRIVRERYPFAEYCIVSHWIWIDIDVSAIAIDALARTQRQPAVLYAHNVIFDSQRRWDVGDFVRTSLLHRFEDGFIFKTLNSVYILMGDGVRKRATPETVGRIF